jgi:hypothetical protein
MGGEIGYAQTGVAFAQGEPRNVGFAPGVGFYADAGVQLSDQVGVYLHGALRTLLFAWTGGGNLAVDFALADHRIMLGTGVGVRGVFTIWYASTYPPSPTAPADRSFQPVASVLVGVPITLALYLARGGGANGARRGVRLGLDTLTGAGLSLQYDRPSLGFEVALTVGYAWY